jgi:hypothetical protein
LQPQNGGSRNRKFNAQGDQQDFSPSSNFFSKEIISPVHISSILHSFIILFATLNHQHLTSQGGGEPVPF